MRAEEVLRYSGVITLAQVVMRSDADPADTIDELARLQRERVVAIAPKQDPKTLGALARDLRKTESDQQLRVLQKLPIAKAEVALLALPV